MKIYKSLIILLIYIFVLFLINFIHYRYFKVDVVFYAAIADGFIASIVIGLMLWLMNYFSIFNHFEKTLLFIILIIGGYTFAISIPTVLDRSLSIYILEKLQQRGGSILENKIVEVFRKEYLIEHRLVDVRLTEQLESGTIEIKNGCVHLTAKGNLIATWTRLFRQNWLPKQRLLSGEYTDKLTNPFKNSVTITDYLCNKYE